MYDRLDISRLSVGEELQHDGAPDKLYKYKESLWPIV